MIKSLKNIFSGKKEEVSNKAELEVVASPVDNKACLFAVSAEIFPGTLNFSRGDDLSGAPLVKSIFADDLFLQVKVEGNKLLVIKKEGEDWSSSAKKIGSILRTIHKEQGKFIELVPAGGYSTGDAKSSGTKAHEGTATLAKPNPAVLTSKLGLKIKMVLQEEIAPALAAHGGSVELIDIVDGCVYLNFSGGCQGCSQASVTVKEGIERALKKHFPEISQVRDITDHAQGHNPFYR
jgi:Fe-S cluster biogenesis protein NfuA